MADLEQVRHDHSLAVVAQKALSSFQQRTEPRPEGAVSNTQSDELGLELSREITAVLLAGGLGTRIRELFPGIPKPMIRLAGLPVIEWVIRLWSRQGIAHFVLSTGYMGDVIQQYFSRQTGFAGLRIVCVREPAPLGTGGALPFVAQTTALHDTLLVGNADSVSSVDIAACFAEFRRRNADVLIGTCFREDASQFGTLEVEAGGEIASFREKVPGPGIVNAGAYMIRKQMLSHFPAKTPLSMEREVFPQLLAEGARFVAFPLEGQFLDIGTPAGYAEAEQFLRSLPEFEAVQAAIG